jgi:thioredoxin-related protein
LETVQEKISHMKKNSIVLIIAFLIAQSALAQESIKWRSFEEVVELNKENPRKVLIDFYTVWCGPCKLMTKNTFGNPEVIKYVNENFYAIKFNAEGNDTVVFMGQTFVNTQYDPNRANSRNASHPLTQMAAVNGQIAYPTVVYLNENWEIISAVPGYLTPTAIEPIFHYVVNEGYISTPWTDFEKTFEGKWK